MSWRRYFRRNRRDAESARDLEFYLEQETADNIARGMASDEARAAARRKLGNATAVREEIHRMNTIGFIDNFWRDAVYALRSMRKNPVFTVTAVLTLALGIGGNTAMFTVIRAVLLKPLEFRDPDRLVYYSMDNARRNVHDTQFTPDRLTQMRAAARSFAALGAYGANPENPSLSGEGDPLSLRGARVSANFLDVLGVAPALGRSFLPEEDARGGPAVAMIGNDLWRRHFGADPAIAGRTVTLDSTPTTIVGVLPAGFAFPFSGIDVWLPRPSEWSLLPPRFWGISLLMGFGRLKPGVTLDQARAETTVLTEQYNRAHRTMDSDSTMRIVWLKDRLVSNVRGMLWMLFGAVGFVLLIACANVAGLLLARATSRSREFAVRAALGAGRSRLIGQLLAESLVLATAGGALGAIFAKWSLSALQSVSVLNQPAVSNALYVPGASGMRVDAMVLGFTIALSLITGVVFGLFPSLEMSRPDLADVLRESGVGAGRASSGKRGTLGISPRALLVIGQVALSVVLLIGAALLMRSFARLHSVNTGFQTSNLLTMKIALPPSRYNTDPRRAAFFSDLVQRVETLPGARSAAVAMSLPTTRWIRTNITSVQGQPLPETNDPTFGVIQSVTPGYFRTLGIPLRRGREFTARDNMAGAPPVMMINESLAHLLWHDYPQGPNPVGQHISEGYDKLVGMMEVVGIVADIHEGGLASDVVSEFYLPCVVHPPQNAYLVVRTPGDPLKLGNSVRSQVAAIDRDQSVSEIRTMETVYEDTLGQRRLTMQLLGSFAGVALVLALIGLYGVIAYSVAQRTHEVGIRRALGAQQGDILKLVLGQGLGLTLAGVVLGIGGAFALTRVMKTLLFQVSATDPLTFAGIALLFVIVALAASYIPAWRASRIDPMAALR
ncbi:MAG TPA: ABC transporter permease [Bryobacteraceae bacterium]|nr:ABC transporter permease [Bryobacteraceae bacterium]